MLGFGNIGGGGWQEFPLVFEKSIFILQPGEFFSLLEEIHDWLSLLEILSKNLDRETILLASL